MGKTKNFYIITLVVCTGLFVCLSFYFLKPEIVGDSISYLEAIDFLEYGSEPSGLIMNRVITTFGGLEVVIQLSKFFGSISGVWLSMNIVFYVLAVIVFFKILEELFGDEKVALMGSLFFASNYAIMTFGLNYLMDMGGWTFYLLSILGTLRYVKVGKKKNILAASFFVGLGGLFKEYAFLASVPIAILLLFENRHSILNLIKESILPTLFCFAPISVLYTYIFIKYDYTYLDWLNQNHEIYGYSSRILEYIKSFGSLFNILGLLFIFGLYLVWREWRDPASLLVNNRIKLFLISIFVSILPIFVWPAITQRVLFVTVPLITIISSFFIKKYINKYYLFIPIITIYLLATLFMDSYILKLVNLPI